MNFVRRDLRITLVKTVKNGAILAAAFFNIFADSDTNVRSKSNAPGILLMHTEVMH